MTQKSHPWPKIKKKTLITHPPPFPPPPPIFLRKSHIPPPKNIYIYYAFRVHVASPLWLSKILILKFVGHHFFPTLMLGAHSQAMAKQTLNLWNVFMSHKRFKFVFCMAYIAWSSNILTNAPPKDLPNDIKNNSLISKIIPWYGALLLKIFKLWIHPLVHYIETKRVPLEPKSKIGRLTWSMSPSSLGCIKYTNQK
jgi:hypothetical protein